MEKVQWIKRTRVKISSTHTKGSSKLHKCLRTNPVGVWEQRQEINEDCWHSTVGSEKDPLTQELAL